MSPHSAIKCSNYVYEVVLNSTSFPPQSSYFFNSIVFVSYYFVHKKRHFSCGIGEMVLHILVKYSQFLCVKLCIACIFWRSLIPGLNCNPAGYSSIQTRLSTKQIKIKYGTFNFCGFFNCFSISVRFRIFLYIENLLAIQ